MDSWLFKCSLVKKKKDQMMLFFGWSRGGKKMKNLYWRQSEARMKHRKLGLFPTKKKPL